MPNDWRQQKQGWKQAGKADPKQLPKHGWQGKASAGPVAPRTGWSLKTKFAILGVGFTTLVSGIILMLYLLRPPKDPQIIAITADNSANLGAPPGVAGLRATELFHDLPGGKEQSHFHTRSWGSNKDAWSDWLQDCQPKVTEKAADVVVLYLGVPGVADPQGRPYFVTEGLKPTDPEDRRLYFFEDLLPQLRQAPGRKLVILDPTQTMACWPLGMLHNDFVRKLKDRASEIEKEDGLVVLCASDIGQRSWFSEEWGQSVFAHYVAEALAGAAAGSGGRTNAADLFEYVRKHVAQWVDRNRDAYQEPILLGGLERARDISLGWPGGSRRTVETSEAPATSSLADLGEKWKTRDKLDGTFPPFCAIAPHQWRRYLDLLLRFEQVLRENGNTTALEKELDSTRRKLEAIRDDALQSSRNSLAGSRAFGSTSSDSQKLKAELDKLWQEEPEQARKRLAQAAASDPDRLDMLALLYQRAMLTDPEFNKVCDLTAALQNESKPLPQEVHFMAMLHKHRRKGLPWERVQQALRVRKLAEEAAWGMSAADQAGLPAYGEQIRPWIEAVMRDGDRKRQLGQDLLFSTDSKDWAEAGNLLDSAETDYKKARETSLLLRRALQARDQSMVRLPYYSQWQAARRVTSGEDGIKDLENVWGNVHRLDAMLKELREKPATLEDVRKELALLARNVNEDLQKIEASFKSRCNTLKKSTALQEPWHEIEAALMVPFLDASTRMELINKSREISAEILKNYKFTENADSLGRKTGEELVANQMALRQARMASAVFDLKGIDPATGPSQVAGRWDELFAAENKSKAMAAEPNLAVAEKALAEAARLAHRLDGAATALLSGPDALETYRKLQLHDFLCWQADRTLADHWFEQNGTTPYYRSIGRDFSREARRFATTGLPETAKKEQQDQRSRMVAQRDTALDEDGRLVASWLDVNLFGDAVNSLNLTDERSVTRHYVVTTPKGMQEGYPVFRTERSPPFQPAPDRWIKADLGSRNKEGKLQGTDVLIPRLPERETKLISTRHVLRGFFRGQEFTNETPIRIYPQPNLVSARPHVPPLGGLAVQADKPTIDQFKQRNIALAIVLDASGSMGEKEPGTDTTRFQAALNALEKALATLPDKMRISLRVFSHKGFENKSQLLWSYNDDWDNDPREIKRKVAPLRSLEPRGETPLVRTMIEAKEHDFPPGFGGTRGLLVLTDGADNDRAFSGPKQASQALRNAFADAGNGRAGSSIIIRAVGFHVTDEEKAQNKAFKDAIEELGGQYEYADDVSGLQKYLMDTLGELSYEIETADGKPTGIGGKVGREDLRVVRSILNETLRLRMRVRGNERYVERAIRVEPGDLLVLKLIPQERDFAFQRDIWAISYPKERLGRQIQTFGNETWIGGVYQNQFKGGHLEMMASLEKRDAPKLQAGEEGTALEYKPALALFGVQPEKQKQTPALRFETLYGYPAPAWGLRTSDWPTWDGNPESPVFDAWWVDRIPPNEADHPFARILQLGADFHWDDPPALIRCSFPSGKADVVLESANIESVKIDGRDEDCLVVRLRYRQDRPFMAMLTGRDGAEGFEHRFYSEAGKYTGIFRGIPRREDLGNSLRLQLISLQDFKSYAEKQGLHAQLKLKQPNNFERPNVKEYLR
jgi:hypothetical protein